MPRPGSAEPGRSTWNMAPESAGVRPPLNPRALGAGRANPSDDPGAGPWDRGPSEQTPGPGDHPRAGLASDGSGLRFYPSTSQPVDWAALARRVADGMGALVTPRLILWQVLPVHGAAKEGALPAGDLRVRVPRGTSRSGGGCRRRSGRRGARCRSHAACADTGDASNSGLGPPRLPPPDCRWAVVVPCGRACRLANADHGWRDEPASACSGKTSPLDLLLPPGGGRLFRIRSNRRKIDDRQTGLGSTGCLLAPVDGPRSLGSSPSGRSVATAPPVKSGPCDHAALNRLSGAARSGTEGSVGPNDERWVRTLPINVWQTAEQPERVRGCLSVAGTRAVPAWRHCAVSGSASAITRTSVPRGTSLVSGQGGMRRCELHGPRYQCPDAGDAGSGTSLGLVRLSTPGYEGEAGAFSASGRRPLQPTEGRVLHARHGGSGCNRAALSDDRPWGDRSTSQCPSASWLGRRS
jgi:hypothetical protein